MHDHVGHHVPLALDQACMGYAWTDVWSAHYSDSIEEGCLATKDTPPSTFDNAAPSLLRTRTMHDWPHLDSLEEVALDATTQHSQQAIAHEVNQAGVRQDNRAGEGNTLDTFSVMTFNALSLAEKDGDRMLEPLRQTGQLKFLCSRLQGESITVSFIQESRLCLPEGFSLLTHEVVQNPSVRGVGGLLTLVAKDSGVKIVSHKLFGPRIMSVTPSVHGHTVFTVNSHAPIRKAPPEVHADFAANMRRCLSSRKKGALLIGGSDFNMRVAEVPSDVHITGPLASHCPHKAAHAHELMRVLHSNGVFLANTFIDSGKGNDGAQGHDCRGAQHSGENDLSELQHNAISTWCHPQSKRLYQIDYILSCAASMAALSSCGTLPWSHFDLTTSSDHRPVVATFLVGRAAVKKSAPQPMRRHKNPAHLAAFTEHVKKKIAQFQPSLGAAPLDTTLELQAIAVESMRLTKPKTARPRQDWITSGTWEKMLKLHNLRKFLKARRHAADKGQRLLPIQLEAVTAAPAGSHFPCIVNAENQELYTDEWLKVYTKSYTKWVRYLLRSDKKLWIGKKCTESQQYFTHNDAKKAFEIVKMLSKTQKRRSGTSLALADGSITHDENEVCRHWTQHWQHHFHAEICTNLSFNDRTLQVTEQAGAALEFHTTAAEVRTLMKTMNKKSVAPDLCPHVYWGNLEPHLSRSLAESFNMCMDQGSIPTAWSGSLIVPIRKPNKPPTSMSSHRPVQLMLMEAKLFSKLLLKHLANYVSVSWLQMARYGVLPPVAITQQFVAHTRDASLSASMVFVDISAAYDDVSHHLMFGHDQSSGKDDLVYMGSRKMGMSHDDASASQCYIQRYPHHILSDQVPPRLLKVLRSWVLSPWFQLPQTHSYVTEGGAATQVLKSTQGIRQGDCLSTYLFCVFFDVALQALHEHISIHTDEIDFFGGLIGDERPLMCTPGDDTGELQRLTLVAYADDIMIPVAHRDPRELLRQLQGLMECMCKVFDRFQLRLNHGAQKTEACIRLTTSAAKPLMQHLKETPIVGRDGRIDSHPYIPFSSGALRVVSSYRHLGRWTGMGINPHQDMAVQRARTLEAFHQNQRVLTSGRYSVATRLYVFKTLVRCHLVQNATSYCFWPPKSVAALNGTYLLLLRRVVFL
eukprot:6464850-Amphidinium_carterae.2